MGKIDICVIVLDTYLSCKYLRTMFNYWADTLVHAGEAILFQNRSLDPGPVRAALKAETKISFSLLIMMLKCIPPLHSLSLLQESQISWL